MENLRWIKFKILMERIQNGGVTFARFLYPGGQRR